LIVWLIITGNYGCKQEFWLTDGCPAGSSRIFPRYPVGYFKLNTFVQIGN